METTRQEDSMKAESQTPQQIAENAEKRNAEKEAQAGTVVAPISWIRG